MGLFKRLRAASSARKPRESPSQSTTSADGGSVASTAKTTRILTRTPSTDLLSVPPNGFPSPPRVSTSSTVGSATSSPSQSARSSMLPWKNRRRNTEELQSIPYESTSSSPLKGSGAQRPQSPVRPPPVPAISTRPPATPTRPPPRPPRANRSAAQPLTQPPQPSALPAPKAELAPQPQSQHIRNPSHESQRTVISLSSTFTGHSRRTSGGSASTEWKQDGGVLGKFAFESSDWGSIGAATPFQSPPHSAGPSKHATPGSSPVKLTSQSSALAMSPTPKVKTQGKEPKEPPKSGPRPGMRKLGASHTSPSLPSVSTFSNNQWGARAPEPPMSAREWPQTKPLQNEKADVTMVKGKGRKEGQPPVKDKGDVTPEAKAPSPSKGLVKTAIPKEEMEEIFSSTSEPDLDEKRRFWKPGMRTRRTSKTRPSDDRPASMSQVEARPPLRRPQSSLFHNPFGRTQSRVSLAFELDQPSPVDDGSFQLKSFRHISGASDAAEGGFGQYLSLAKAEGQRGSGSNERSAGSSTVIPRRPGSGANSGATSPNPPASPSGLPRRPPSAAGSDSSQRVSVAAFRKNIRRPSSSLLMDDDDDVPLSLSRAQLFEGAGLHRDSGSAVSLSDHPSPPARPTRALPPTPDESRGPSPSPIGLGAPPPLRNSTSPSLGFVVKGARRHLDAKDAKRQDPIGDSLPFPAPVSAPAATGSPKVMRPPRQSSLTHAPEDPTSRLPPPIVTTPPEGPKVPSDRRTASRSPPPPPPAPLNIPEPQASPEDLMIKLPPRPDELPDGPNGRDTPTRGGTLSPTFIGFEVRRISGLWSGGTPEPVNDDKEDAFDPSLVESALHDSQRGGGADPAVTSESRQSLYDRLAAATSSAISSASNALPTSDSSERLYIPPVGTPSPPPIRPQSRASDRTASPVNAPPVLAEAPAIVPAIPHSSFGRPPRAGAEKVRGARANKQGWASSSDDDEDDGVRARPATSASTLTTRSVVAPRAQPAAPRPHSSATLLTRDMEVISGSSDEDEPLQALKTSRSRSDLHKERPVVAQASNSAPAVLKAKAKAEPARPPSILKTSTSNGYANGHANPTVPRPRTGSMPNGQKAAVTPSASKWSLSSTQDSDDDLPLPVRPGSRPGSRGSAHSARSAPRPASHVSIARDSSAERSRPLARMSSSEQMAKPPPRKRSSDVLPRNRSSDLLPRPPSTDRLRSMPSIGSMHQPAPRHPMSMVAAADGRPTASPASSQSGLTGDSSGQQPMTPRSGGDISRRSWADGRLRPDAEVATARGRPASQFDWASAAGPAGGQMPMGFQPGMDPYGAMNKQHMYAQFKAMADAHFEDMWERASSVSNANTAPQSGMFQQSYGYSYNQPPMPMMPAMPYGGYGQYPYGGYGGPQVAFPGGMPMGGMMSPMGGMPMQGMPMGGGSGYSYGPGAQSVYGGEFGPPVAPGMRENVPGSPGGSPSRRARRTSGQTDVASSRPTSMAQVTSSSASVTGVPVGHYAQQRAGPPRRQGRRVSGLSPHEGGPPSSWRASMGDDLETPRPKRVTNAS